MNRIVEKLLQARGIEDAERFFNPTLGDFPSPGSLPGINAAAERILAALAIGREIVVFGDYDCDGVCATAIMVSTLRTLGAKVVWCERYADHHRYDSSEILYALNRSADMGADALVTTEKDAVRFPRFETSPIRCLYLRIAIEILSGGEHFLELTDRICFRK